MSAKVFISFSQIKLKSLYWSSLKLLPKINFGRESATFKKISIFLFALTRLLNVLQILWASSLLNGFCFDVMPLKLFSGEFNI